MQSFILTGLQDLHRYRFLLRELLKVAAQINVTVTIPEFIPGQKGMSEDLFNASKKTADALLMLCKENMQEVEEIVNLREKSPQDL